MKHNGKSMKKYLIAILTVLLIAVITAALVACTVTDENGLIVLKTPKLAVNGNTVTWNTVKHAEKYGVAVVGKDEIEITGTSYTVTDGGVNKLKVRAIGDKKKYGYSDYSEEVSVTTAGKLATPKMNDLVIESDGSATLSWASVDGASAYKIELRTEGKTIVSETVEGTSYKISADAIKEPAYYSYRVRAISGGTDADSEFSPTKNYTKSVKLETPDSPKQSEQNAYTYIEFNSIEFANKYTLEAYNDGTSVTFTTSTVKDGVVQMNLSNIGITEPGTYKLRLRAENSSNNLCAPSEFADVMKKDGVTPLTLTYYDTPTNVMLDQSILSWDKTADDVKYVIEYSSNKNTQTSDSTNALEFDLSKSAKITSGSLAGLLTEVTVNIGKDLENGILGGKKSEPKGYTHVEKPSLSNEGEFNGYYEVDTIAKLNYINTEPDKKYVLTKNIDCSNGFITPIAKEFKGILNGNGYSINRFELKLKDGDTRTYIALFGSLGIGARVTNLGVFDATVSVSDNEKISAAVITNINNGEISDVTIKATVKVQNKAAAVAIENNGIIRNAFASVTISGNNSVGGIVAVNNNNKTVQNARVFDSELTAAASTDHADNVYLGGIAGVNNGTIKYAGVDNAQLTASTHIKDKNVYLGGIVGRLTGTLSTAYAKLSNKTISAITNAAGNDSQAFIGGLVGIISSGKASDCYAIGGTYIKANYAATFAAEMRGTAEISDSYTSTIALNSHSHGNFIAAALIDDGIIFKNAYYYNVTNHKVMPNTDKINGLTQTDRTDISNKDIVRIDSMSKTETIQEYYLVLNDLLYFPLKDSFVNTLASSAVSGRETGKVFSGAGKDAGEPKKFATSGTLRSGITTFDAYSIKLDNGTVITLSKTFKITG